MLDLEVEVLLVHPEVLKLAVVTAEALALDDLDVPAVAEARIRRHENGRVVLMVRLQEAILAKYLVIVLDLTVVALKPDGLVLNGRRTKLILVLRKVHHGLVPSVDIPDKHFENSVYVFLL